MRPASFLLLLFVVSAWGDISLPSPPRGGKPVYIQTPEAAPVDISVRRGESVEIPLRVFGVSEQPVTFRLRKLPRAGALSGVRMVSEGAAVVLYEHSGERLQRHDRFSFTAQTGGETSSDVEVNITIIDAPPALGAPREVDFGTVRIGSTATKEIAIENRGGGVLKGTLSIDEPWKLDGKATYNLRGGEKRIIRLRIAPVDAQTARGEIRYSSDPDRKTALSAAAEAAVAITPERLELGASRAGTLTIANRTGEEMPLRLRIGGKLKGPERAVLPAGGTLSVRIEADDAETGPIDGAVQVESPGSMADVAVHAPASGPLLKVIPSALSLGNADGPKPPYKSVTITNAGGTGTFVRVEPSSHLVIARGDSSFWLEAGLSRNIAVSVEPMEAGKYHERLAITSDANGFDLPVSAEVARARTAAVTLVKKPAPALFESLVSAPAPKTATSAQIGAIRIRNITATTCEISWRIPPNTHSKYRVESFSLLPGAPADAKHFWIPLTNIVLRDSRGRSASVGENWMTHGVDIEGLEDAHPAKQPDPTISASVDQLSPSTLYSIRIVGKDGDFTEASRPFLVRTAQPSLLTSRPFGISVSLCLGMLAVCVWHRKRQTEEEEEDEEEPKTTSVKTRKTSPGPYIRELRPGSFEIGFGDVESAAKLLKELKER